MIRRVRLDAARISHSPRSRRRRTIPAEQLNLALSPLLTDPGLSPAVGRVHGPYSARSRVTMDLGIEPMISRPYAAMVSSC